MQIKEYAHVGCMGSGKTTEIIRVGNLYVRAGKRIVAFRPNIDDRSEPGVLVDKNGMKFKGQVCMVKHSQEILTIVMDLKLEAFVLDEGQFMDPEVAQVFDKLAGLGVIGTYAGLDTNFLAQPFPTTAAILCLPEIKVFHWKAICDGCGETATRSIKRLPDNTIVTPKMESQVVEVGEAQYNAVCYRCFMEAMAGTLSIEKLKKLINKK